MKRLFCSLLLSFSVIAWSPLNSLAAPASLRLLTQSGYLSGIPVLVRVDAFAADGSRDREFWNADAILTVNQPGVTLSTNRVALRNGVGSVLVIFSGGGNFNLTATVGSLQVTRALQSFAGQAVTKVGGTLPGAGTTWTGIISVTNDVTVPVGHTLTIQSNTLVLLDGVASGTVAPDILVSGTIQSLGTEPHPVTITCSNATQRWGQIRHNTAQPSLYRHTMITRGGRAPGEGHTSQAPVIRPNVSTIVFESCSITDHAEISSTATGFGTPGKIMFAINSDLTFRDCLLQRARMGPEIQGTALVFTNSYIMDMKGPDDADGIYLHDQQPGQLLKLSDSVFAFGDDDGIDTLGSVATVENCIIRDWTNPTEDAKGISGFDGAIDVKHCLIVDCWVGVSAKANSGASITVQINNSTIIGISNTIGAQLKPPAAISPIIDFRITNSIIRGVDPFKTDFGLTNFTVRYSDVGEAMAGTGNITSDPLFVNEAGKNFRLRAGSPAINAGNPSSPLDADGSIADMGFFPANGSSLIVFGSAWKYLDNGSNQGTNWTARVFNDGSWSNGVAQLGYGDADEATVIGFGPDANNKYITTYFRKSFVVFDPTAFTNLEARLLFDDGGVVYLNGTQIMNVNMPANPVTFQTLANLAPDNSLATNIVPASLLLAGTNVIAVEIHQNLGNSTDLSFDLELVGLTGAAPNVPPTVSITSPASGANFPPLTNITITANASDSGGSVTNVVFLQNNQVLGQDAAAPYSFQWNAVPVGAYTLTTIATDNLGASSTSAPVNITVSSSSGPSTNILIAAGSVWKYLDNGTDQGATWTARTFNDASWLSGPGQLGYGDGDEATVLGFGPDLNNKYVTTYFRRAFTVSNPADFTTVQLQMIYDDGAVVHLNGQEVLRFGMPTGPITFQTLSGANNENMVTTAAFSPSLLIAGTNVLAVEIHQVLPTSSDLSFDLQLTGIGGSSGGNSPPSISISSPASGANFVPPASITITANANDSDGSVTNVQFYQNNSLLGEDVAAPYSITWNNVSAGAYVFTAVATDNLGLRSTSAPVNITIAADSGLTTNILVAAGTSWKYLDNGSDQGTNWILRTFNDSSWSNGVAQLGYGDGDEITVIGFGPDPNNKYITSYFRRLFNVDDATLAQSLTINLLRDDGAVVYINGQEVWRVSMPAGPVTFQTPATTASEYVFEQVTIPPASLVSGTNIIAVEVHQSGGNSSDVSFDLQLSGVFAPATNRPPIVSITSPADNTTISAPGNVIISVSATDRETTVSNVLFFANSSVLGSDTTSPYSFPWSGVAAGNYLLRAVATDNTGLSATSAPVNLIVSTNTAPPVVANKTPAPGTVTSLTQINVTFSKAVQGVNASDLLINGVAAASVSGSGSNYTFSFAQPAYGTVAITWAAAHGITDLFTPPSAFNASGAGATWQYQFLDAVPPSIATISPIPNSTVAALNSISITFSEPVTGVNAPDLLINSAPASSVTGSGAGPYAFSFAQPPQGTVQISWASAHGIQDGSGNPFAAVPWSYILDTNNAGIVISEIMYHPASENVLEEYIELFNKGASAVNLNGWQFTGGVQFTFTNVTIPGGGYLVVVANRATFQSKYPGVANVVGDWIGFLNNSSKDIDLDDANGNRADSVRYADEGDWAVRQRGPNDLNHRGWIWFKPHDGGGRSLELINANLSNNNGQNWASSLVTNGTPGRANSVLANNIAPMILEATHFPVVPRSTETLIFSARIVDEAAGNMTVRLNYRVDSATPPAFSNVAMHDDGVNGDAVANDGIFSATLSPQANNTIIEWYISATDFQNNTRTWPAPAIAATDGAGPTGQVVNALLQVDDTTYTGTQPLHKLIMTETERAELQAIPSQSTLQGPNSRMNGTFISIDGSGTELRYSVGIRNRGHGSRSANPPNYHVDFRSDEPWKGVSAIIFNAVNVHVQHLGSVVARKAGAAGANAIAVQVRVNNQNRAVSGAPMFGSYVANEVLDGEWAQNHFPNDPNGNVYRAIRDIGPPDFSYRGENKNSYTNTYFKESNQSEDNWTDLIGMSRTFGINNTTPFTTANVRQVINVEQWLRHLAVMNLYGNNETGLNTGFNDDYSMYAGVNDPRFILMYYDLDTIFGQGGSLPPNASIFTATQNNGSGAAMDRFMHWPEFEPLYYQIMQDLLNTTFAPSNFNATVDQALASYVPQGTLDAIKSWMAQRVAFVQTQLPAIGNSNAPIATISGTPRSPTPFNSAALIVGGAGVVSYRFSLNGGAFSADRSVATPIVLSGLANGTNTVAVIGRGTNGVLQATSNATVRAWVVNTSWPAVRLNEVLADNVAAANHNGTFPDTIELFNEGSATVDLSGMRLSDAASNPSKFTFPSGTTLASGAYLVVYANDPDGTPGLHLGFALDQASDQLYLFNSVANGGALLDSVSFGIQLADLSIGRVGASGDWQLVPPSFGAANVAQPLGNERNLRINEWLASSQSQADFIELYNPNSLPVALGGLFFTDQLIGEPTRSPIAPLSFIAANGFTVFTADGDGDQADHVNFSLAIEQGEIGLFASDLTAIDSIIYGPQQLNLSQGRCPNGALTVASLPIVSPGNPNNCSSVPLPPQTVSLLTISNVWRYQIRTNYDGVNWTAPTFNDAAWPSGPALLGQLTPTRAQTLPEPIRTVTPTNDGQITFYFRAHFNVPSGANYTSLQFRHIIDDGALFYLNGTEIPGSRFNMPAGTVTFSTLTSGGSIGDAAYQGPFTASSSLLVTGDNVFAVELHQSAANSSDVAMGVELVALIVTNAPSAAGVVINEVLANNTAIEDVNGNRPDWVELYNPSSNAVDVANMSLTDDPADPRRWVIPSGTILPARGFLRLRCDADLPLSTTNTGFGLKANGGAVYLFNRPADGGTIASTITYGLQAPNWSIGRVPDGGTNLVLTIPSLGSANIVASLGDSLQLKINEWLANPSSGDDWFEVFNPNPQPVNVSGFYLTDDLNDRTKHRLPALSFLGNGAEAFQRFDADDNVLSGADHVNFKLSASGDALAISTASGGLINAVGFGPQAADVSQGRLPDGANTIVSFPASPTPGHSNFLPLNNVVVNELLAHSDPPFEDAVEFYNPSGDDVDISGWYLSDSQDNLLKWRVPVNTIIRAGGYVVFYEYQFNPEASPNAFSFSSAKGDEVYLSQSTAPGTVTGHRAFQKFDASENGVSFGRFRTSVGDDFTAMSARTFGADNPTTTNEFRAGIGRTNAYPKVGPVVINEIMYHPADTNDVLEFVELQNITASAVSLFDPANPANTWRMRKGIDFDFPPNTTIPAGGFLVLVSFDPQSDATSRALFQSRYGTSAVLAGPYSGKLDNNGEALELQKPDAPQTIPGPDFGLVPYIVADRVVFSDTAPWPISPDGTGDSLKRVNPTLYGNEPLNWSGGAPNPGAANFTASSNRPPALNAIANRSVHKGFTVTFTNSATDPDLPGQTLTFSLVPGAPAGATIGSANGVFTWATPSTQAAGNYPITVRVTDNGVPALSDMKIFTVAVIELPQFSSATLGANNSVTLTWASYPGRRYRIEYTRDLGSGIWTQLGSDITASSSSTSVTDLQVGDPQRFYRILSFDN